MACGRAGINHELETATSRDSRHSLVYFNIANLVVALCCIISLLLLGPIAPLARIHHHLLLSADVRSSK